jgi:hypothetical protein
MSPIASLRRTQISPTAVLLTGAAVIASMIIGLTGPKLRDRHCGAQQELPVGELAYGAEVQALQQEFLAENARALPAGPADTAPNSDDSASPSAPDTTADRPPSQPADAQRIAKITLAALGRAVSAPDLSKTGFQPVDARIAQLAPGTRALAVLYERVRASDGRSTTVTIFVVPDVERIVRFDGFGRALPFAPGDEWASSGLLERTGPASTIYATADHDLLWLLVAPEARLVVELAPYLHGGAH